MNSKFQYESNTKVIGKGCNMLRKYCNHSWACSPQEPPQGPADSSAGLRGQARHFLFLPFLGVIIIDFFLHCSSLLLWHDMNHSFLNLSWCCPDVVGLVVTSVACLSLNLVREPVAAHDPDAFCSGIMAGTESVPMEECVVNWDSRWFKYVPAILKIFEVCSVFQFPHSCLSQRHWWSADHSTSTQRAEVLTVFTGLTPDAFGRKRENFCLLCRRD